MGWRRSISWEQLVPCFQAGKCAPQVHTCYPTAACMAPQQGNASCFIHPTGSKRLPHRPIAPAEERLCDACMTPADWPADDEEAAGSVGGARGAKTGPCITCGVPDAVRRIKTGWGLGHAGGGVLARGAACMHANGILAAPKGGRLGSVAPPSSGA